MTLENELLEACRTGDLKKVKYLVSKGANIHADNDGALRWAAVNGQLEVVKYLVSKGANIHAGNDWALQLAAYYGQFEIVLYLRRIAGKKWKCYDCLVRAICINLCRGWGT